MQITWQCGCGIGVDLSQVCFFFSWPVFAVQELVDFEHIQGIEWSQESEDEDETVEGMELAEWNSIYSHILMTETFQSLFRSSLIIAVILSVNIGWEESF